MEFPARAHSAPVWQNDSLRKQRCTRDLLAIQCKMARKQQSGTEYIIQQKMSEARSISVLNYAQMKNAP